MKFTKFVPLSLSLLITVGGSSAAFCSDSQFTRMDSSAAEAFAQGDYKRADGQWYRLLDRLNLEAKRGDESKSLSEQIEATLRHLGECALAQKNYDKADDYLGQAKSALDSLQEKDEALDKDYKDLSVNYRLIDLGKLGDLGIFAPIATAAIGDFHPSKVSVARTDAGHHVTVVLADDIVKEIGQKGITAVGVNKIISFDLIQGGPGEVTLANIVGIKVHAAVWVNIVNSCLKLDDAQRPVALVTAQKMGISQSVSTPVPDMIYLPVLGLVSQVKNLFTPDGGTMPTATATATATGATAAAAPPALQAVEGTGIAPVTNNSENNVSGAVIPIPMAQPESDQMSAPSGAAQNTGASLPLAPISPLVPDAPANNDHIHVEHIN